MQSQQLFIFQQKRRMYRPQTWCKLFVTLAVIFIWTRLLLLISLWSNPQRIKEKVLQVTRKKNLIRHNRCSKRWQKKTNPIRRCPRITSLKKGQAKLRKNISKSDAGTWLNVSWRNLPEKLQKKKNDLIEACVKCRDECNCQEKRCAALGLKQCPVCKNVLHSICSKVPCKTDGIRPIMILSAKHNANKILKQPFDEKDKVLIAYLSMTLMIMK